VQPGCAGRREAASDRDRVFFETADILELALAEPDGLSAKEVDGGNY
jgi:hypothetical protein